jgi:molecular chaperone DnaK
MIYNIEKTLKEHREKVGEEEAKNIEAAIADTKKAMTGGSTEEINAATDKLTAASHKLAEAMYKASSTQAPPSDGAASGAGAGGGPSAESKKKDDVVDAEFVDVDDKK